MSNSSGDSCLSPSAGPSHEHILSPEQVRSVVANCQDLEERILIKVPLFMGLRIGELVHMRRDWLVSNSEIRVPSSMFCTCDPCLGRGGVWEPKTKSGSRIIPLSDMVRQDVVEFLNHQPNGLEVSRFVALRKIKKVLRRAKVQQGFCHALCATCATMLAANGATETVLMYLMGWSTLDSARPYIRIAAARTHAAEVMKRAFQFNQ